MQIWEQKASQITNIESLNWNFNIWWNKFDLSIELDNNKNDIVNVIGEINELLLEKWFSNNNIEKKSLELKSNLDKKSEKWILKSYKEYVKELNDVTKASDDLWNTVTKLLSIWSSIWKFITLLF